MSFILEALKKVERQHAQNRTPLAVNGTISITPQRKRWPILMITGVIAVMMFGLGVILERQEAAGDSVETAALPEGELAVPESGIMDNRVEEVDRDTFDGYPDSNLSVSVISDDMRTESVQSTGRTEIYKIAEAAVSDERGVHFADLPANVRSSLPMLKVDVHYYQELPANRFVMINQHRYAEGDQLVSGPLLVEIFNNGVILKYRGQRFVLPRL